MSDERANDLVTQSKKFELTGTEEIDIIRAADAFIKIDKDNSGEIDVSELRLALVDAGHKIAGHEVRQVLQSWKRTTSGGGIVWEDFLKKFAELKTASDKGSTFNQATTAAVGIAKIGRGSMKSYHSYDIEERIGFADWANRVLGKDPDMKHLLPINLETEEIFEKVKDGILLCKLINSAIKDTIDNRSINKVKAGKTSVDTFRSTENLNLALNSASSIGATVVNIGAQDILDGRGHLVLGLMWQIIEIGLMAGVSLENNPHIAALLEEDEEMSDLQRLGPEAILLRWFNYHLRNDKTYEGPVITNFKSNIKDSIGYCHLLAQIQPDDIMPRIPHNHTANSDAERAEIMLKRADILDCRAFLQPRDILNGTEKLNLAFVANLFNNHPALEAGDIEIIQETREEKTYRNWMNSLGVKPRLVRIYYDIKNGVPLYDIMKQIDPDVVKDSKITVALPPYKKFSQMITQIGNCNQVVELGKKMGFTLIGISGDDIYNENGKLTLALLWQMMRAYSVQVLKKLGDGKPVTDKDILNWVNSKISEHKISSFKDPSITTSLPIYRLINAIRMNTIDFKVVDTRNFDKMDDENKHSNARYALSQARKLGATVYALPDDVTEGNAKMITTVFASLMVLDKQQQQALAQ